MTENTSVIMLMGPTAAGKTDVAVQLLEKLPCEIISVDSALVYRGMDIGTAKPDVQTLARAPHRLINIREPHEIYSAADFCADAEREILDIQARGRIPLLVGGTLLYFRALQQGLADMPAANPEIRAQLQADLEQQGLAGLHARLAEVDPVAAERIHVNDPQRILRALEVWLLTGKSLSAHHQQAAKKSPHRFIKMAWSPAQRELLHQRIELRFAQMLAQGFVDEVAGLRANPRLNPELPSMRAVGYRQVWQHLDGRISAAEMSNKAIVATRQLAKRQLTWLRGEDDVAWFDSQTSELSEVLNYIQGRL